MLHVALPLVNLISRDLITFEVTSTNNDLILKRLAELGLMSFTEQT